MIRIWRRLTTGQKTLSIWAIPRITQRPLQPDTKKKSLGKTSTCIIPRKKRRKWERKFLNREKKMQRKRCTTKEPRTSQKNQNHPPDTKTKLKSVIPKVAIFLRRILLRSLEGKRNHRRVRRILPRLAHSYFSIVRTRINSSTTLTHHPLIVSLLEVIISMVNKM